MSGPLGGGGAPASALAEARAMKTSADFTEQQVHFAAHARVATRAAEAGPEQPANRYGCAASAFTRERELIKRSVN